MAVTQGVEQDGNEAIPPGNRAQAAGRIPERLTTSNGRPTVAAFAVIVPTLDESACIVDTIEHLRTFGDHIETIVVDGGSRDDTVALAQACGVRVLQAARGRGPQMNAGAASTHAETLVFLHADCRLPKNALGQMQRVLNAGYEAGVFSIDYGSAHPVLRLLSVLSRLETRWTQFGEAALFVRSGVFETIGRFPDWPLFEDVEILSRLRRRGRLGHAAGTVHASARRFEARGVVRQLARNLFLYTLFSLGVAPHRLQRRYGEIR